MFFRKTFLKLVAHIFTLLLLFGTFCVRIGQLYIWNSGVPNRAKLVSAEFEPLPNLQNPIRPKPNLCRTFEFLVRPNPNIRQLFCRGSAKPCNACKVFSRGHITLFLIIINKTVTWCVFTVCPLGLYGLLYTSSEAKYLAEYSCWNDKINFEFYKKNSLFVSNNQLSVIRITSKKYKT